MGWFEGRMEFLSQSLGNRSILADPRNKKIKDVVNKAVKYRENFRPFAPAVISEFSSKIFNLNSNDNIYFMEKAVMVKNSWEKNSWSNTC